MVIYRDTNLNMEEVFQYISKNFVTVDKGRMKSANPFLKTVIKAVTDEMKIESPLFKSMYETHFLAGSAYDGLKVGRPDEFDIDLKLFLPRKLNMEIIPSDKAGFVYVRLTGWAKLHNNPRYSQYRELDDFIDDDYFLSHLKIKKWMNSIVAKALKRIDQTGALAGIDVISKESGPAVTLKIEGKISIDLVPVFRIPEKKWPGPPVRQNFSATKVNFLIVPKSPKVIDPDGELDQKEKRYWRLSFPEQEMEYMNNLYTCKPVLRFIKKLRDTQTHNIPSYFIKTIFLWEVKKRDEDFWKAPFVDVFIEMLKVYNSYLSDHDIPYFWNSGQNFIKLNHEANIINISNFLEGMIEDIEENGDEDPLILAEYLLPKEEYEQTRRHFETNYGFTPENYNQSVDNLIKEIKDEFAHCRTVKSN